MSNLVLSTSFVQTAPSHAQEMTDRIDRTDDRNGSVATEMVVDADISNFLNTNEGLSVVADEHPEQQNNIEQMLSGQMRQHAEFHLLIEQQIQQHDQVMLDLQEEANGYKEEIILLKEQLKVLKDGNLQLREQTNKLKLANLLSREELNIFKAIEMNAQQLLELLEQQRQLRVSFDLCLFICNT